MKEKREIGKEYKNKEKEFLRLPIASGYHESLSYVIVIKTEMEKDINYWTRMLSDLIQFSI